MDLFKIIERIGLTPLPYYIKRAPEDEDKDSYQTIFAKNIGSVAAPTASLHFTRRVVSAIEAKGVKFAPVTLHLGLGSFRPVEVEDPSKHKMDSEYYEIPQSTVDIVNRTIDHKGKVFVVGTSTARAVESSVTTTGHLKSNQRGSGKRIPCNG